MTQLLGVFVPGHPRSKGSLRCQGGRPGQHRLVEQVALSKPWREEMQRAIVREVRTVLKPGVKHAPHEGPVRCVLTFFFEQPATGVSKDLPFPVAANYGDLDKLTRNVLDALQGSGLIKNDSQVTSILCVKRWGAQAGASIKVYEEVEL